MQLCYAFNKDGLRCMQLAGHDGTHSHAIEWDDADCWTPGTPAPTTSVPVVAAPPAEPTIELEDCVVCGHGKRKHSDGGCSAKNDAGDECGCFEFV